MIFGWYLLGPPPTGESEDRQMIHILLPSSEDALPTAPAPVGSMDVQRDGRFPSVRGCLQSEVALRDALLGGPAAPAAWTL